MLRDEAALKFWPDLVVPSPAIIVPLPVNRFPNKIAPKFLNNTRRNPTFCSFAPFLIVLVMALISKPDTSSD